MGREFEDSACTLASGEKRLLNCSNYFRAWRGAAHGAMMFQRQAAAVRELDSGYAALAVTDMDVVRQRMRVRDREPSISIPWAMQMNAVCKDEPSRLVPVLTGAILGCGGWVLSRGANDTGMVNMLFEFERQACVDIYSVLIAAGLELSQSGHIRLTELCQCTLNHQLECGAEIASVDLEIQTSPREARRGVTAC